MLRVSALLVHQILLVCQHCYQYALRISPYDVVFTSCPMSMSLSIDSSKHYAFPHLLVHLHLSVLQCASSMFVDSSPFPTRCCLCKFTHICLFHTLHVTASLAVCITHSPIWCCLFQYTLICLLLLTKLSYNSSSFRALVVGKKQLSFAASTSITVTPVASI